MKKLSEIERSVLGELEFCPEESIENIARKLHLKRSTIYYMLRKMEERGAIVKLAFIDSYRLGFQDVGIFFKLSALDGDLRDKVIDTIVAHERVVWFGALAGDYNFGITLLVRDISELQAFFEGMAQLCGSFFVSKVIVQRSRTTIYSRKYLRVEKTLTKRLTFSRHSSSETVDEIDERLLTSLAVTPYKSLRDIARSTTIPLATVERRLRRLGELGIFQGVYYGIAPRTLGVTFYRILLSLSGVTRPERNAFEDFCAQHVNITFLVETIGSWDYEVGCEVTDTSDLPRLLEQFSRTLGKSLVSANVLTEVKDYKFAPFPFKRGFLARESYSQESSFEPAATTFPT